jgi:hypothetical protein
MFRKLNNIAPVLKHHYRKTYWESCDKIPRTLKCCTGGGFQTLAALFPGVKPQLSIGYEISWFPEVIRIWW